MVARCHRMKKPARLFAGAFAGAVLAGCATVAANESGDAARPVSISYETGPCFGACPVYRVSVGTDGRGSFEGKRFTAVEGARSFIVTSAQFNAFERHLRPLRPSSGSVHYAGEACAMTATDLPSANVEWKGAGGDAQSLHFYFGCDMEKNEAIAERLRRAPELLPIAGFIRAPS